MTCGKDVLKNCELVFDLPFNVPFDYQLYKDDKKGKFYLLRQGNLLKSFKKNKREVFYKLEKIINWHQRRRKQKQNF